MTERTKLYEEMQVIENEEAPDLKIAHSVVYEPMRKDVDGLQAEPARRARVQRRGPQTAMRPLTGDPAGRPCAAAPPRCCHSRSSVDDRPVMLASSSSASR